MNKTISGNAALRIIKKDGLNLKNILWADAPECTKTGAKLAFISEKGWMLVGYSSHGEDVDLRHWNG